MIQASIVSRCLLGAACLSALIFPLAVNAQKVKQGSVAKAKAKAGVPLMTRDELRDCMALAQRNRVQGEEILALPAQIELEKADLQRHGAMLTEALAALDRTSVELVDQYNAKAAARDKSIEAFDARVGTYNLRAQQLQTDRAAYASACENRRFDEKDEIAIKNGK